MPISRALLPPTPTMVERLPGLRLWLCPERFPGTDNATLTKMTDQSRRKVLLTSTSGREFTYRRAYANGRAGLVAAGSNSELQAANFFSADWNSGITCYAVYNRVTTGNQRAVFSNDGGGASVLQWVVYSDNGYASVRANATGNFIAQPWLTTRMMTCAQWNGSNTLLVSGNDAERTLGGLTGPIALSGAAYIGRTQSGAWPITDGLFELIVCQAVHDWETRQRVRDYLARRWDPYAGATTQVVFEGDSLTWGQNSTAGSSYPNQVMTGLGATYGGQTFAIPGDQTTQLSARATKVDALLHRRSRNVLVCWVGTNDLAAGASAATTYAAIVAYCQARRTAGWKVVVGTILPRNNDATFETKRTTVNTSIRDNWATFADALADIGADTTIGESGDEDNTTYYHSDKIHLTDAGYTVVAGVVQPAIEAVP